MLFPDIRHIAAGLTAVVVGYSSAVVLVIEAARASGVSDAGIISWLTALGLGMGISCLLFSWQSKMPVVTAWSTPGAAFLIGSASGFPLSDIIGAFLVSALLTFVCVSFRSLFTLIARIPASLSAALLAGILIPICVTFFTDFTAHPAIVSAAIALYLAGLRYFPRFVMLILLAASLIVSLIAFPLPPLAFTAPQLIWQTPSVSVESLISLAIPLFLITMLSQNLPGIAIHHMHGYRPNHALILKVLAVIQAILAPFGAFTFNLAAITAALCMEESVDSRPDRRYLAGIVAGVGYLFMALMASVIALLFIALPGVIVHLLAGLALIATLHGALAKAMEPPSTRTAATLTILCCASGMSFAGLSAPVWGLLVGLLALSGRKEEAAAQS
ncbi:benzoate/H(+) symporter BenE family transporter [Alteromonas sp. CYL-A6]|uniref:benzoate/H(+) symporter BenE family transporter n=1 Tax=Alteromonas nitratireducens TaxID=3390813 RepID=UPI0034B2B173